MTLQVDDMTHPDATAQVREFLLRYLDGVRSAGVPKAYIVCKDDRIVALENQYRRAEKAGTKVVEL
ncbi:hypothetical protein AAE478_001144 [Parahypoxylon ruwenzoriense]